MKKLITIIALILPILTFPQKLDYPSVMLRTLDEKTVHASELLHNDDLALVYFFTDNSKEVLDQLDYLKSLSEDQDISGQIRIIAIYNVSTGSYGNVKAFLYGNDITVETYIDLNGELQRAMGLAGNSTLFLSGFGPNLSDRYTGSYICCSELVNILSDNLPAGKLANAYDENTRAGNAGIK